MQTLTKDRAVERDDIQFLRDLCEDANPIADVQQSSEWAKRWKEQEQADSKETEALTGQNFSQTAEFQKEIHWNRYWCFALRAPSDRLDKARERIVNSVHTLTCRTHIFLRVARAQSHSHIFSCVSHTRMAQVPEKVHCTCVFVLSISPSPFS